MRYALFANLLLDAFAEGEHSLKTLYDVKFCTDAPSETATEVQISCWSCRSSLTNNIKIFLLRGCGHVFCTKCTDIARPAAQCPTCDAPVEAKNGIIELAREGTGFSSGGQVEVRKFDLQFQG